MAGRVGRWIFNTLEIQSHGVAYVNAFNIGLSWDSHVLHLNQDLIKMWFLFIVSMLIR